jgi:signal transduction histidine kinase
MYLQSRVSKLFSFLTLMAAVLLLAQPAHAEDSTPEQAKAHAEKAAEYVRANGAEAAAAEFNKKDSEFVKGDLYVFAVDKEGVFLSHPIKPALVGKNMISLKDVEGTPLIKNFVEIDGEGWSPYKWPHPVTKKILPKKSYIINVDGFILGVGAYYEE